MANLVASEATSEFDFVVAGSGNAIVFNSAAARAGQGPLGCRMSFGGTAVDSYGGWSASLTPTDPVWFRFHWRPPATNWPHENAVDPTLIDSIVFACYADDAFTVPIMFVQMVSNDQGVLWWRILAYGTGGTGPTAIDLGSTACPVGAYHNIEIAYASGSPATWSLYQNSTLVGSGSPVNNTDVVESALIGHLSSSVAPASDETQDMDGVEVSNIDLINFSSLDRRRQSWGEEA